MSLRFLAALFAFAISCSVSLAAGPAIMPEKFHAVVGGFLGSTYVVELRDGALHYTERTQTSVGPGTFSSTVIPTAQQWQEFRKSIDQLRIWQWQADYPNKGVADGTQWSLEIAYADHALKTRGDNNYPDATGKPNGEPNSTKTFDSYLAAVKKLIGGRSFE